MKTGLLLINLFFISFAHAGTLGGGVPKVDSSTTSVDVFIPKENFNFEQFDLGKAGVLGGGIPKVKQEDYKAQNILKQFNQLTGPAPDVYADGLTVDQDLDFMQFSGKEKMWFSYETKTNNVITYESNLEIEMNRFSEVKDVVTYLGVVDPSQCAKLNMEKPDYDVKAFTIGDEKGPLIRYTPPTFQRDFLQYK